MCQRLDAYTWLVTLVLLLSSLPLLRVHLKVQFIPFISLCSLCSEEEKGETPNQQTTTTTPPTSLRRRRREAKIRGNKSRRAAARGGELENFYMCVCWGLMFAAAAVAVAFPAVVVDDVPIAMLCTGVCGA